MRGFALAAALVLLAPPAAADPLHDVFREVLANPGDIALNLRYAELAAANGEEGRALAAYERVLARDPDNRRARRAYRRLKRRLRPAVTAFTFSTGAEYESNPRQVRSGSREHEGDVSFDAWLRMFDERTFAGHHWRTRARAGANRQIDVGDLNNAYLSFATGPMIDLGRKTRLHIAPGAAAAWLDDEWLYYDAKMRLTLEQTRKGAVQSVFATLAQRETNSSFNSEDGLIFHLGGRFIFHDMLIRGSRFYVIPRFRASEPGGNGPGRIFSSALFPGNFIEAGGRVVYYKPVAGGRAFLGGGFGAYFREYDQNVALRTEDRSDVMLEPTAHLLIPDVKDTNFDFRLDYRYEHNDSNDPREDFDNHVFKFHTVRRF